MKAEELKTIVIKANYKELKQLALVGIISIIQTNKPLKVGASNTDTTSRHNKISTCCKGVDPGIRAIISSVSLNNYNKIDIMQDK